MLIYIMRHGDAVSQAKTDFQRPLSDYGRRQVQSMVLSLMNKPPTRMLVSPYLRAQQTAEIIQCGLTKVGEGLPFETVSYITPNDSADKVVDQLGEEAFERVLLVSHQPLVGSLLTLLVEGHNMGCAVNTASILCLECEYLGAGQANLNWIKTP